MSQVIVTDDRFKSKRDHTKEQESKIDIEGQFKKWHLPDVSSTDPILKLIGVASLPIVAVWGVLLACGTIALTATVFLLKALGSLFRRRT